MSYADGVKYEGEWLMASKMEMENFLMPEMTRAIRTIILERLKMVSLMGMEHWFRQLEHLMWDSL